MYNRTCPYCGAYLDPGEVCDCQKDDPKKKPSYISEGSKTTTYSRDKKIAKNETCYTQY